MAWDDEYDVVVAGSGAGALAGALAAASNEPAAATSDAPAGASGGLRTAVLEKTALVGGTSAYSGSAIWLPGTRVQERAGIGDSTDSARAYLRALLGDDGNAAHREAFLETAPELVEFLERDPAVEFEWRAFPDYFDAPGRIDMGRSFVPLELPLERLGELAGIVRPPVDRDRAGRGHAAGRPLAQGRSLIGRLLLAITATGNGDIRTGTALTELIVEDGRVVGVAAMTADGPVRLRASRGVLLAAGGFESSAELRASHGVPGGAGWTMAPDGANTGDAIAAAMRIGASTGLLDQAWFCPGLAMPDGRAAFTLGFRGGLIVDGTGLRFANESLPYDRMGRRLAAADGPFYLIFDSRSDGLPAISIPTAAPEEQLAAGRWHRADTLAGLAAKTGLPAGALASTVERFNGFAAKNLDEDFHRGEDPYDLYFTGGKPCLVPVDRPPFIAAEIVLSDLGTKGGLRTDPDGRVLSGADRPIPGLYAAGNTSASFTGPVYPGPGIPIGTAMAFAYRAVQAMRRNHS
ncbi:FAD-binding protein [Actinomadura sp. 1N219]|uniref:FAD-binding protein n=1 Tax=Actinomadura sp. 1N219 TaxID=3375152 RepID=UPI00379FFA40